MKSLTLINRLEKKLFFHGINKYIFYMNGSVCKTYRVFNVDSIMNDVDNIMNDVDNIIIDVDTIMNAKNMNKIDECIEYITTEL